MGIKYNDNGTRKEIKVKVGDNIPVGAEFDYDGSTIPVGYEEITDPNTYSTTETLVGKWEEEDGTVVNLYRKIFYLGSAPNATDKAWNIGISAGKIRMSDVALYASGEFLPGFYLNNGASRLNLSHTFYGTQMAVSTYTDRSGDKVRAIIWYVH